METIADRIKAWANTHIRNSGIISRETEVYNHMMEAVGKLLAEPWADQPVQPIQLNRQARSPTETSEPTDR